MIIINYISGILIFIGLFLILKGVNNWISDSENVLKKIRLTNRILSLANFPAVVGFWITTLIILNKNTTLVFQELHIILAAFSTLVFIPATLGIKHITNGNIFVLILNLGAFFWVYILLIQFIINMI